MSQPELDYNQKRQARTPHNIFNLNVILVHLFAVVILFELNLIHWFWVIPVISLSIMLLQYFYWKSLLAKLKFDLASHWYVAANWSLAVRHNRIVFIAYLVCGSIFLIGYTISNSMTSDPNMSNIEMMIFLYLSSNLMLLTLVITFVLSSGAIWHTNKGEITRVLEKIKAGLEPSNSI
ncbi:hypothetical protein [Hydrogenovibrio sp. JE_KL2]|uniref:hypothetical protein n=1 Tax=Hydrogenovibrio sp. JE_KL2 TaxID=2651188 RepID=UPI00128B88E3|nr:hypothetical protein [Hydrogenovibrio sp. JE_KL2]MPQ75508.1 hypothetical protein [Hydrogenovibrio sp. JE_KL2]